MCFGEIATEIKSYKNKLDELKIEYNNKIQNPLYESVIKNKDKYEQYYKLTEDIKN